MRLQHTILMVEDDPFDVGSVKRAFALHKLNNRLHVVGDGVEALEYLRNEGSYADTTQFSRPSLILLDLKMPRMGGLEFLERIKSVKELRTIPIVILTASAEESDILQSYHTGASSYLVKPMTFEKLAEAVRVFDLFWTLSEIP